MDGLLRDNLLSRSVMQQNYYIARRTDGAAGSGTREDPWDGSTQAKFDTAMSTVPPNSTIFLGSTYDNGTDHPFETKGFANGSYLPQSGQRIVGSGIGVTTIKLVNHAANI